MVREEKAKLYPVIKTSLGPWMKKRWYLSTIECYSAIKRMNYCHLQQCGWNLENIMLREVSQMEKV